MIRFVEPVKPRQATGLVAEVYREVRRDFRLLQTPISGHSPFPAQSPNPQILAGMWSMLYETMLVGAAPRAEKEAIAAAVSTVNACPFCADAHAMLRRTADRLDRRRDGADPERRRRLVQWATPKRAPDSPILRVPPFDTHEAPEMIGVEASRTATNGDCFLLRKQPSGPFVLHRNDLGRLGGGSGVAVGVLRSFNGGHAFVPSQAGRGFPIHCEPRP